MFVPLSVVLHFCCCCLMRVWFGVAFSLHLPAPLPPPPATSAPHSLAPSSTHPTAPSSGTLPTLLDSTASRGHTTHHTTRTQSKRRTPATPAQSDSTRATPPPADTPTQQTDGGGGQIRITHCSPVQFHLSAACCCRIAAAPVAVGCRPHTLNRCASVLCDFINEHVFFAKLRG